jgi:Ca2+-binding EF-hand superfamily protein
LAAFDTASGLFGGPYTAFQRIDRDRDDFITADELLAFLKDNRMFDVSLNEASYIIEYFDCNSLGKLNYTE